MPVSSARRRIAAVMASFLFSCFSAGAQAEILKILPVDKELLNSTPTANVYFSGNVTPAKIKELLSTVDEVNLNYRSIKKINLYISSYGGDMDSGFAAYWAIKSSPVPITAVNLSTVGSAATMIFCASGDRQSIKGGRFIIHPAARIINGQPNSYQPDELMRLQQDVAGYNKMLSDIYKDCTNFKEAEIDEMLSREDSRKLIFEGEAKERGIVKGTVDKIAPASLVYYISDAASSR